MTKFLFLPLTMTAVLVLSGCTETYEASCADRGLAASTPEFQSCLEAEESATVRRIRARGYQPRAMK